MTLDQRAALRNKIGDKYADIKTGVGMQQRAAAQAGRTLRERVRPVASLGLTKGGMSPGEADPENVRRFMSHMAETGERPEAVAAAPAIAGAFGTGAGMFTEPIATLGALAGSHYGSEWLGNLGKR